MKNLGILAHPLRSDTLTGKALDLLRQAILQHEIPPGMPINIRELAQRLDVSPIPIREALRCLEAEGLVTFTPNKGVCVTRLSQADLNDIYSLRIPLEVLAIKKIFSRRPFPDLALLDELHEKMCSPTVNGAEWFQLNRSFHMELHSMAASPRLFNILQGLWNSTGPYLRIFAEQKDAVERANREHDILIEALRARNRVVATKVLSVHLKNGFKVLKALLPK